jgi:HlyD family secretion protein
MEDNTDGKPDITQILKLDQVSDRAKRLKKPLAIAAVIAACIIALVVGWNIFGGQDAPQYKTEAVTRGNITVLVTATGTLQATTKVDVGSELSGIVKTVEVNYNDRVKVGQPLAKLDTTKLESAVVQAKASLDSAKAKVLQTRATVLETKTKLDQMKKARKLSNNRVLSQADYDAQAALYERALADDKSARAAAAQAKASLDANQIDLSKAVIRSPINGIVLARSVEPGQTVASSLQAVTLFTLAEDLTKMELQVNVDEADIGKIQAGQKATFTVSAYPNRTFDAIITRARYGSTTTSGVVTYVTELKVDNPDLVLRPGMTATADIIVKKVEDALLVPSGALRFSPPVQEEKKQQSGGLVGSLLPRPPRPDAKKPQTDAGSKKEARVWTLSDGGLTAVPITIGETDGRMTEVVKGDIGEGAAVVVDIIPVAK